MRTRKLLVGATFFAVGLGYATQASAQLQLKGSDTLEDVAKDAVAGAALSGSITYIGGGSGGGQAAMTATTPTQQIAPMSRQLNGAACSTLGATVGQELIGLDGIAVVGANQLSKDSDEQSPDLADDCSDNISGGLVLNVPGCTANDGCDASGNYTFADWKDVLAMVYGGQNHNTAQTQLSSGARNPARINCNSPVRRALVDNWGNLFRPGTGAGGSCRTAACTKLRHAFRRDDLSGTTDTFVGLVGMVSIPPYTTTWDGTPVFLPKPDSAATANPFCNAGEAKMNKGDSDYLDLDPIRRAVDHQTTGRVPMEQVGSATLPAFGGNNNDANCAVAPLGIPTGSASSSSQSLLPSQVITGSTALLQDELGFPAGDVATLTARTHACLGLVLPIAMPSNYTTPDAYFGASEDGVTPPVPCSIDPATGTIAMADKTGYDNLYALSLCPDGKPQPCSLPVNTTSGTANFNCFLDGLNPTILPLRDNRGFHLHPLNEIGQLKRDNYSNPNIPLATAQGGIPANRQARVVSAFYRLHFSRVTTLNGSVPTIAAGNTCRKLSATNQIGCLVKANACSIGFAGREAVDVFASGPKNMAFRIADKAASVANIENLFTTPATTDDYPMARGLYVNSVKGFANVTGAELTLLNFFRDSTKIDPIIQNRNFIKVPAGVTRSTGCPRP